MVDDLFQLTFSLSVQNIHPLTQLLHFEFHLVYHHHHHCQHWFHSDSTFKLQEISMSVVLEYYSIFTSGNLYTLALGGSLCECSYIGLCFSKHYSIFTPGQSGQMISDSWSFTSFIDFIKCWWYLKDTNSNGCCKIFKSWCTISYGTQWEERVTWKVLVEQQSHVLYTACARVHFTKWKRTFVSGKLTPCFLVRHCLIFAQCVPVFKIFTITG